MQGLPNGWGTFTKDGESYSGKWLGKDCILPDPNPYYVDCEFCGCVLDKRTVDTNKHKTLCKLEDKLRKIEKAGQVLKPLSGKIVKNEQEVMKDFDDKMIA